MRITLLVEYNLSDLELTEGEKMAEPTYDELKARLEELEKKGRGAPANWTSRSAKKAA